MKCPGLLAGWRVSPTRLATDMKRRDRMMGMLGSNSIGNLILILSQLFDV